MISLSPHTLRRLSAFLWLIVGSTLFSVGLRLISRSLQAEITETPFMSALSLLSDSKLTLGMLVGATGVLLGCFKGHFALGKSAQRLNSYYKTLPNPSPIYRLYPLPYYALLAVMMGLGMLLNFLQTPSDIRGFIDIAIGVALLIGGYRLWTMKG